MQTTIDKLMRLARGRAVAVRGLAGIGRILSFERIGSETFVTVGWYRPNGKLVRTTRETIESIEFVD